jgi:hypothetical protein
MSDYNANIPTAPTSLRASNPQILENQDAIQTAVNNEHEFSGTTLSTQGGYHTQGSARCFSQATAPATRIDGTSFESTDLGSLWIDTDDNSFYILTATTPTWTPVSTEVISTILGSARTFLDTLDVTNKFTALADAEVTTTLDVGTSIDIGGTIPIVGTIDDDTMATATDTNIATSESIKAYVDTKTIVNIEQSTKDSIQSITSSPSTFTDITGLSVSITPSSANSKILVYAYVSCGGDSTNPVRLRLFRGATNVPTGASPSSRIACTFITGVGGSDRFQDTVPLMYLDSPATTSPVTYKISGNCQSNWYVNRSIVDGDDNTKSRATSNIIVQEILQ